MKIFLGILVCAGFMVAKPLSEAIKDIEVSGEMDYKYEHTSKKTSKDSSPKQDLPKATK